MYILGVGIFYVKDCRPNPDLKGEGAETRNEIHNLPREM